MELYLEAKAFEDQLYSNTKSKVIHLTYQYQSSSGMSQLKYSLN